MCYAAEIGAVQTNALLVRTFGIPFLSGGCVQPKLATLNPECRFLIEKLPFHQKKKLRLLRFIKLLVENC